MIYVSVSIFIMFSDIYSNDTANTIDSHIVLCTRLYRTSLVQFGKINVHFQKSIKLNSKIINFGWWWSGSSILLAYESYAGCNSAAAKR